MRTRIICREYKQVDGNFPGNFPIGTKVYWRQVWKECYSASGPNSTEWRWVDDKILREEWPPHFTETVIWEDR